MSLRPNFRCTTNRRFPGDGYVWTPGYWAWGDDIQDYYWVPGTWVPAPEPEYLWTPGYWAADRRRLFLAPGLLGPAGRFLRRRQLRLRLWRPGL